MIYGPKNDGTYIIEFRIANGEALAISVPAGETRVLKYSRSECLTDFLYRMCREEPLALRCVALQQKRRRQQKRKLEA
jgi:hypothetical protein